MSDALNWIRRAGHSASYFTADTEAGRVRISRVNKTGVALFRVRYPDGKGITVDSIDSAKSVAQANYEDHATPVRALHEGKAL